MLQTLHVAGQRIQLEGRFSTAKVSAATVRWGSSVGAHLDPRSPHVSIFVTVDFNTSDCSCEAGFVKGTLAPSSFGKLSLLGSSPVYIAESGNISALYTHATLFCSIRSFHASLGSGHYHGNKFFA